MKLIDMTCPKCGAQLKADSSNTQAKCEFCGADLLIDDEVKRLKVEGAEEAGYEFEKGRQRAKAESQASAPVYQAAPVAQKKKHGALWWVGMVLLWIMFLPIMATIYVVRNKNLSRNAKIGIVAAIWVVFMVMYAVTPHEQGDYNSSASSSIAESAATSADSTSAASASAQENKRAIIDAFIKQYNETHDVKITDTVEYDPYQAYKTRGDYYRVEFRLGAYKDSTGVHGAIGDDTIDIITSSGKGIRVYVDQNDRDYERTLTYAHDVVDAYFAAAGYTVPSDKLSSYEDEWNRFDEGVRDYDYAYATSQSLFYNDYPAAANVSILSANGGKSAELLADLGA